VISEPELSGQKRLAIEAQSLEMAVGGSTLEDSHRGKLGYSTFETRQIRGLKWQIDYPQQENVHFRKRLARLQETLHRTPKILARRLGYHFSNMTTGLRYCESVLSEEEDMGISPQEWEPMQSEDDQNLSGNCYSYERSHCAVEEQQQH
jgi:hypothetical protein